MRSRGLNRQTQARKTDFSKTGASKTDFSQTHTLEPTGNVTSLGAPANGGAPRRHSFPRTIETEAPGSFSSVVSHIGT